MNNECLKSVSGCPKLHESVPHLRQQVALRNSRRTHTRLIVTLWNVPLPIPEHQNQTWVLTNTVLKKKSHITSHPHTITRNLLTVFLGVQLSVRDLKRTHVGQKLVNPDSSAAPWSANSCKVQVSLRPACYSVSVRTG